MLYGTEQLCDSLFLCQPEQVEDNLHNYNHHVCTHNHVDTLIPQILGDETKLNYAQQTLLYLPEIEQLLCNSLKSQMGLYLLLLLSTKSLVVKNCK